LLRDSRHGFLHCCARTQVAALHEAAGNFPPYP
jgi:hypothetical protein